MQREYALSSSVSNYLFDGSLPLSEIVLKPATGREAATTYEPILRSGEYLQLARQVVPSDQKWQKATLIQVMATATNCVNIDVISAMGFTWNLYDLSKRLPSRESLAITIDGRRGTVSRTITKFQESSPEPQSLVGDPTQAEAVLRAAHRFLLLDTTRSSILTAPDCLARAHVFAAKPSEWLVTFESNAQNLTQTITVDLGKSFIQFKVE